MVTKSILFRNSSTALRRRSLFITAVYVVVLAWAPAFFAHQACQRIQHVTGPNDMYRLLNWMNCHVRFPPEDRTFEAYSTWIAAVAASAAIYWAWRSFSVQAETLRAQGEILREQERAAFLSLMKQYHARFSDDAFWIAQDVRLLGKLEPSETGLPSTADNETHALALVMLWAARSDKTPAEEWARSPGNANNFVNLAEEYERQLDRHGLEVFKTGVWLRLLRNLQKLRGGSFPDKA